MTPKALSPLAVSQRHIAYGDRGRCDDHASASALRPFTPPGHTAFHNAGLPFLVRASEASASSEELALP
ncbi:hypothetical protein [Halostagnicola bangensis]